MVVQRALVVQARDKLLLRAVGVSRLALLVVFCVLNANAPLAGSGKTIHYEIKAGRRTEGPPVLRVTQGEVVTLVWKSSQRAEIHLHGYNLLVEVPGGGSAEMKLDARATGRFPITLHGADGHGHAHKPLAYLEVHPK